MRKYQPIWEALKQNKQVRLAAPNQLHPRIIKAVTKEKERDLGFKLLTSEEGRKFLLFHTSEHGILSFRLKNSTITIGDL